MGLQKIGGSSIFAKIVIYVSGSLLLLTSFTVTGSMTQPSNTLKQRSETAETNELSSCFPHTSGNSPTKISLGPAANTESIVSRLQQFASKYQSTQRTTYDQSYIPSAGHRGEEEMLSNVLEICCRFCKTVNPPARQVPFYCPFQVYIPIYF